MGVLAGDVERYWGLGPSGRRNGDARGEPGLSARWKGVDRGEPSERGDGLYGDCSDFGVVSGGYVVWFRVWELTIAVRVCQ